MEPVETGPSNNTPPLVTPEVSSPTDNDLNPKSSSKNKSVVLILVLLILGLLSVLVYLFYQNIQLRQQVENMELEKPTSVTCEYNGQTYEAGEGFTASDGCNSCSCSETGEVACTLMACLNEDEKSQIDPATDWETYTNDKYSFKYPKGLNIYSPNPETEGVKIIYLGPKQTSSGRTETEVFDGYTFSVIGLATTNTTSMSFADDDRFVSERFCKDQVLSDYVVTSVNKVNIFGNEAYQYSVDNCVGNFTNTYIENDDYIYRITQTYEGDTETKQIYKTTTDQILSTFQFTD